MEKDYKIKKFQSAFPLSIRKELLPENKISVAFAISGVDLSTLEPGKINFDMESDKKLEEIKKEGNLSAKNRAFEYVSSYGFDEVDANTQTWFKF